MPTESEVVNSLRCKLEQARDRIKELEEEIARLKAQASKSDD